MMGERMVMQKSLVYGFSLEDHVPADNLLRRSTDSSTFRVSASICGPGTATARTSMARCFMKATPRTELIFPVSPNVGVEGQPLNRPPQLLAPA